MNLYNYFDKCYLINLKRRTDRLSDVQKKLSEVNWPFKPITIFEAIDGNKIATPKWFRQGSGAFGCARSHIKILEDAQMMGYKRILIIEDDFYFLDPKTAIDTMAKMIYNTPENWDILQFGGQHIGDSPKEIVVGTNICKSINCQRTHFYAVQGIAISQLYTAWLNWQDHIDWYFKDYMPSHNCYSPIDSASFIGQENDPILGSDINTDKGGKKLWRKPDPQAPVFLFLNTPLETIEALRFNGFHFGNRLDIKRQDVGLDNIWRDKNLRTKTTKLRSWVNMLNWESYSRNNTFTGIWHEECDIEFVKEICKDYLVILDNPTVKEAQDILEIKLS